MEAIALLIAHPFLYVRHATTRLFLIVHLVLLDTILSAIFARLGVETVS